MSVTRIIVTCTTLSLALAIASIGVQRVGPQQQVEGEGFCATREPCEVPALGAGFPLPFLVDDPQVSVPNSLGFGEDEFRPIAFALDVLFYWILAFLAVRLTGRWLRGTPA